MTYTAPFGPVPRMVPALGWWVPSNQVHSLVVGNWDATGTLFPRIRYFPLIVPTVCVVRRMWWANGSTVSVSYSIDAGVYADAGYKPGAKLVSAGSTAQGTALQVQFVDVTDTVLTPGLYWMAIASSSSSATFLRTNTSVSAAFDASVCFQESTSPPLPATATPVETSSGFAFCFGFATTASP